MSSAADANPTDLVHRVRDRVGAAGSYREAEATTAAVLRALCERLGIGLTSRLGATLPRTLVRRLRGVAAASIRFTPVETSLAKVAVAGHVSLPEARRQAVAVAEVLPADVLAELFAEVSTLAPTLSPREAQLALPLRPSPR